MLGRVEGFVKLRQLITRVRRTSRIQKRYETFRLGIHSWIQVSLNEHHVWDILYICTNTRFKSFGCRDFVRVWLHGCSRASSSHGQRRWCAVRGKGEGRRMRQGWWREELEDERDAKDAATEEGNGAKRVFALTEREDFRTNRIQIENMFTQPGPFPSGPDDNIGHRNRIEKIMHFFCLFVLCPFLSTTAQDSPSFSIEICKYNSTNIRISYIVWINYDTLFGCTYLSSTCHIFRGKKQKRTSALRISWRNSHDHLYLFCNRVRRIVQKSLFPSPNSYYFRQTIVQVFSTPRLTSTSLRGFPVMNRSIEWKINLHPFEY